MEAFVLIFCLLIPVAVLGVIGMAFTYGLFHESAVLRGPHPRP